MTLTDALRAALAEPADLEPMRRLTFLEGSNKERGLAACAMLLLHGADPSPDRVASERRALIGALVSAGAPYVDTHALNESRSAEWTAAAERLAAWADGVAS
jgi:hypothetical protein